MDRETILRLAREAGYIGVQFTSISTLERFAALIEEHINANTIHSCHSDCTKPACVAVRKAVAHEREACAKIAQMPVYGEQDDLTMAAKDRIAAAIRSRT